MTTKEEVIAAIETAEARVTALAPALLEQGQTRLPDSDWDVREALSHVAARANPVPLSMGIMQRMLVARNQGRAADLGGRNRGDDINQAQLDERQERSVAEVLAEIRAGHQDAIAAVRELPQEQFDQRFPRVNGDGEMSLGELILRAGSGHENEHVDQIERAIAGAAHAA